MAAAVGNRVTLGRVQYDLALKDNEKARDSTAKQVHRFASSGYGAWRITQVPEKLGAVAAEIATLAEASEDIVRPIREVTKVFGSAANGMIFAYGVWATFEVTEQISKVAEEGSGERWLELFRRCTDWVTAACHSVSSLLPSSRPTLGRIALGTDLINDTIESYQAATNWVKVDELLSQHANLSEEVQQGLKSEKILHLISLVKSIIGVVGKIFVVLGLVLAIKIAPPIVLAIMGLAGCSLAFVKHFFKENMSEYITRNRFIEQLPA